MREIGPKGLKSSCIDTQVTDQLRDTDGLASPELLAPYLSSMQSLGRAHSSLPHQNKANDRWASTLDESQATHCQHAACMVWLTKGSELQTTPKSRTHELASRNAGAAQEQARPG